MFRITLSIALNHSLRAILVNRCTCYASCFYKTKNSLLRAKRQCCLYLFFSLKVDQIRY